MILLAAALAAEPGAPPAHDARVHAELMSLVDRVEELHCATPLVLQLREHWAHLSPGERAHATAVLAPFKDDLFAPLPEVASALGGAPPPASSSCFSQQGDTRLTGTHFVVEYDDGVDPDDAQRFLDALEYSWDKEVDELGWQAPDGTSSYLLLAYVRNQNTGGAYTTVAKCGNVYMPYIVTGKDSWRDPDWGDTMAAHEFNHAIQYSYGTAAEFWWWEATATFIEDYVYPNVNYWSAYVTGYTDHPEIALAAYSQSDYDVFYHMYGMAIFAFYLDHYHGGHDTVQLTWEKAERATGTYTYGANNMAEDLGLDWDEIYTDFASRNTVMEYNDQRYYGDIQLVDTVKSLPDEGESGRDAPQGYGQNYIKIESGAGPGKLVVDFETDERVDFAVQLVESSSTEVLRNVVEVSDDGEATVTLNNFGDDDVWLVISPLKYSDNDTEYAYSWSARLEASTDDPGDDTGGGGRDDTGNGNGDGNVDDDDDGGIAIGPGCACDAGAVPAGLLALLPAVLLARRRR